MGDSDHAQPPRLRVRDVMTPDPPSVPDGARFRDAAEVLRRSRASDLVVVGADGRLVGVLSEGDLLRAVLPQLDEVVAAGGHPLDAVEMLGITGRSLADQSIARLVIRDPITVGPDDELLPAAAVMVSRMIRRLPVVDDGHPVGTLSRADLCAGVLSTG